MIAPKLLQSHQDTNNLKGNVPVVEARQVIDSHGNFQGWEFRQRGQPGPEDMLTRVNNNEIGLYTNLVEDGNLATVVLNVAVGYMKDNKINVLDYDFHLSPDFNITTGEFDRSSSQSSELTDPQTNNTFLLPQAQLTELRRLGEQQQIANKVWQVNKQGACATKPEVKASTFIRSTKEYFSTETSCSYFVSQALPDVTGQIESITARDQEFSNVKGSRASIVSRLNAIINSKIPAWNSFNSITGPEEISNEASIYRRRLIVCIMDEFRHGGSDGHSRFVLKSETGSREMSYIEAAEKMIELLRKRSKRS
jgi:hypothetical protein